MTKRKATMSDHEEAALHREADQAERHKDLTIDTNEPDPDAGDGSEQVQQGHDTSNTHYVKIGDVKLGDMLIAFDCEDMDCLVEGQSYEVGQNANGRLLVHCEEGEHFLDKDVDQHDYLMGLGVRK